MRESGRLRGRDPRRLARTTLLAFVPRLPLLWCRTSSLNIPHLHLKRRGATSTTSTLTRMRVLMKSWRPRRLLLQAWEQGPQHHQRDQVPVLSTRRCWRMRPKRRMTSPSLREG